MHFRIEYRVPEELEQRPVKLIRARLGSHQYGGSGTFSGSGGIIVSQHLRFLDAVYFGENSDVPFVELIVIVPVEEPVLSRDPPTERETESRVAASPPAVLVKKLIGLVDRVVPGVSVASGTKAAAIERKVGYLFGGNDLAESWVRGFDGDLGSTNLDDPPTEAVFREKSLRAAFPLRRRSLVVSGSLAL